MIKYTPVSSFPEVSGDEYNAYKQALNWIDESRMYYPDIDYTNKDYVSDLVFVPTNISKNPKITPKEELPEDSKPVSIPKKETKGDSKLEFTSKPGNDKFDEYYLKSVGEKDDMYKFLSKVAHYESGYNPKAKNPNAPAYGYFQFMQDGVNYKNITDYGDVDIDTFLNTPEIQINAARSLADTFLKSLKKEDLDKMAEKGITKSGALGGMWLGGYGGLKKYLYNNENISDKHWSPSGAGIDMKTQIKRYNGLFKKGGSIEKASLGTILSTNESRDQSRPGVGVLKNDYFGKDRYDYSMSPEIPDDGGHWPSRDPYTGLLLKNKNHPTVFHEYEQSSERGLKLYEDRNGRQYTLEDWQVNMPEYIIKGLKPIEYPNYGEGSVTMRQRIDANMPKVRYIWDRLISAGASKEQAAAILGNMYRESHFDYKNINKDSKARGLVQMLGQRWEAYEEYLALNPDKVDSTESQMDYLIPIIFGDDKNPHGLKNLYKYKIKDGKEADLPYDSYGIDWSRSQRSAFRNAKTLEDMVAMFENKFERAKGNGMAERQAAARYIYNLMK